LLERLLAGREGIHQFCRQRENRDRFIFHPENCQGPNPAEHPEAGSTAFLNMTATEAFSAGVLSG